MFAGFYLPKPFLTVFLVVLRTLKFPQSIKNVWILEDEMEKTVLMVLFGAVRVLRLRARVFVVISVGFSVFSHLLYVVSFSVFLF